MEVRRATVTQAAPLRVRLDGASSDSAADVIGTAPALAARVQAIVSGSQVLVLAGGGGHSHADMAPSTGSAVLASDGPAAYPGGVSYGFGGTAQGWPENGVILTVRYNSSYTGQTQWSRDNLVTKTRAGRDSTGWGAWQALADEDTGWITMSTGWANGSSPYATSGAHAPRYRKRNGIVYMDGLFNRGATTTAPVSVYTLPAGFRPSAQQLLPVAHTGPGVTRLDLFTTGVLHLTNYQFVGVANAGWHTLAGISFPADL